MGIRTELGRFVCSLNKHPNAGHREDREVGGPKDLNLQFVGYVLGEILRASTSDALRMANQNLSGGLLLFT